MNWANPRGEPRLSTSARQRIGPELELDHLAGIPFPTLHVEGSPGADRGPDASALPAGRGIVDSPFHPLRVEPERIRHAQHDPLSVVPDEQALGRVARVD